MYYVLFVLSVFLAGASISVENLWVSLVLTLMSAGLAFYSLNKIVEGE